MLKRFEDNELLGESASRRVGYHCEADYAKSSKAKCRVCTTNIEQNELRLALMLQDDEGYKSKAWTHFDCFWKHPEMTKVDGTHEIHNFTKLKATDQKKITTAFENFNAKKKTANRKVKGRSREEDRDDEEFSPETKTTAKKIRKKSPASKKRKRGLENE